MSKFAHLHVHSHYSLLDGLPKIPDLVASAKAKGFTALALTDHGSMYGAVEFYKECTNQGLQPIIGVEAYVAPRQLTDKEARLDDRNSHLVLLARNLAGYRNLLKLITLAHLQGFYYKPRIDHEALRRYSSGLIALSACLKGEIPQALLRGDEPSARQLIATYRSIFGEGNFFLEVQAHPELKEQQLVNAELRRLGVELGLPLVATADSHYLEPGDRDAQDILVCIQTGKKVADTDRLDMRGVDTSLKDEATMRAELPDFGDAIDQTFELAAGIKLELELGKRFFPAYPTPQGETPEAHLRLLTEHGLAKHFVSEVPDVVRDRMEYELGVIMKKGYASYFLVVGDFVNWARGKGIIATTRGSAAGSLVSYLIGITTINPLSYGLPFERFLNPERPSPPDIDMDFADNRRDDVIAYVTAKYGVDHVAQIVTFGTMQARAAVRDVGRALGLAYGLCDMVAKLIPVGSQGFHMTIERALREAPELRALSDGDPQVANLLALAQRLEGCARHASVHAAGVVISPTPLTDHVPLQYDGDGQQVITQYDMWSCEDVGLVKMDFLGIRNLSIMGSAVKIIEKTKNIQIDLERIPMNDAKTFDLMAKGETMGMFQLGGSGMTRYLKELKPSTLTDIMAMVALFRPGPMNSIPEFIRRKHNAKAVSYLDPRLKDILAASYGIITYQDDVLLIAINLAGYTWEEADKLRKAMGKKILKEMARQKEKFISGCIAHGGLTEARAVELWQLIEPFAAYGFNKAHAASYAIVAYQTAYLKANYPSEFMAALMTAEAGDMPTIAQAVAECRHMGIEVLPPDVNESLATFTVVDERRIRFGLNAIKNLGEQIVEVIIAERKTSGPFTSLEDLLRRSAGRELNKKSLESLVKCGALDSLQPNRQRLLSGMEIMLAYVRDATRARDTKQSNLFGNDETSLAQPRLTLPELPEADKQTRLAWERELLGLYVTEHPFADYAKELSGLVTPLVELLGLAGEPNVKLAGLITAVKPITTKKGDSMLFFTLQDMTESVEAIAFPDLYREEKNKLVVGGIIALAGRVSRKNGEQKVIAEKIYVLVDPATATATVRQIDQRDPIASSVVSSVPAAEAELTLRLPTSATREIIEQLKAVLVGQTGHTRISFLVPQGGGWKKITTPYRVTPDSALRRRCQELLGDGALDQSTTN